MSALADQRVKEPVTVAVHRRVQTGREAELEAAMRDFIGFALSWPGHLEATQPGENVDFVSTWLIFKF